MYGRKNTECRIQAKKILANFSFFSSLNKLTQESKIKILKVNAYGYETHGNRINLNDRKDLKG